MVRLLLLFALFHIEKKIVFDRAINHAIEKCAEVEAQPVIIHTEEVVSGLVCNPTSKQWERADGSAVDYKPDGMYHKDLDEECTTGLSWDINPDGYWNYGGAGSAMVAQIFCTKQLQQPIISEDGCDGFEDDEDDGVCYQVGTAASNWQDAQLICKHLGANLASVHNLKENSFVRRQSVANGTVNGVFLGGSLHKDGTFGWIDGTTRTSIQVSQRRISVIVSLSTPQFHQDSG